MKKQKKTLKVKKKLIIPHLNLKEIAKQQTKKFLAFPIIKLVMIKPMKI